MTALAAGVEQSLALAEAAAPSWLGVAIELGELGDGSEAGSDVPVAVCAEGESAPCTSGLGEVTAIAAGRAFGLALLGNGTVRAWGYDGNGALGDGSSTELRNATAAGTPVSVGDLAEVTALAAGERTGNSLALAKSGELMAWGGDYDGSARRRRRQSAPEAPHEAGAIRMRQYVCAPPTSPGPCPDGPYLDEEGKVLAMAGGTEADLVSLVHAIDSDRSQRAARCGAAEPAARR